MPRVERSQDVQGRFFSVTVISEAIRTCTNEQKECKSEIWVSGGDCRDLVDSEAQCYQQQNQTHNDVHTLLQFNVLELPCLSNRRLNICIGSSLENG